MFAGRRLTLVRGTGFQPAEALMTKPALIAVEGMAMPLTTHNIR